MTDWTCKQCGTKIRFWISLCKICNNKKRHSTAIISHNKTKLKKLLDDSNFTVEWFDKFILYTNNIIENWKVMIEFIEKDNKRRFQRIKDITINK